MRRLVIALIVVLQFPLATSAQQPQPAQAVAQAAAPVQPPALSDEDTLLLSTLKLLLQTANRDCQGLESVKAYNQQRSAVLAAIEKKYPGYVVNEDGTALVAKPSGAPK